MSSFEYLFERIVTLVIEQCLNLKFSIAKFVICSKKATKKFTIQVKGVSCFMCVTTRQFGVYNNKRVKHEKRMLSALDAHLRSLVTCVQYEEEVVVPKNRLSDFKGKYALQHSSKETTTTTTAEKKQQQPPRLMATCVPSGECLGGAAWIFSSADRQVGFLSVPSDFPCETLAVVEKRRQQQPLLGGAVAGQAGKVICSNLVSQRCAIASFFAEWISAPDSWWHTFPPSFFANSIFLIF